MFKVFKYLLLANVYKRAKKSIVFLLGLFVFLLLFIFIINDILAISSGVAVTILLFVKWIVILTIFSLIARTTLQLINITTTPFEKVESELSVSEQKIKSKKEHILGKEKLYTKSDMILEKYMKDQ